MRAFILIFTLLTSANAFASGGAICGRYTAELVKGGGTVTIVSFAADFQPGLGYSYQNTKVTGAVSKICSTFFLGGGAKACGLALTKVRLIGETGCFPDSAATE